MPAFIFEFADASFICTYDDGSVSSWWAILWLVKKCESGVQAKLQIVYRCIISANGIAFLCIAVHRIITIRREGNGIYGLMKVLIRDQAIYLVA